MSKVAIQGNASGTGTFTIAAPNSNTDRTLTLPDEAGTVLTSGTPLSSFPSGFANGITMVDQWRPTTNSSAASAGARVLNASWQRVNTDSGGGIGTGMTESSGTFTFPSTGVYWIAFGLGMQAGAALNYAGGIIRVSTDSGSTYSNASSLYTHTDTSGRYLSTYTDFVLDVTNTSTISVQFWTENSASITFLGSTVNNDSFATFIRLGDT